jgi:DNA-binding MarR family transcriptional regulator
MKKSTGDLLSAALQQYDQQFSSVPSPCSARQLLLLRTVKENSGVSQTKLVALTGIDRSTLTDVVRILCKRRLLERRRTINVDARVFAVKITDEGLEAIERSRAAHLAAEKFLLTKLSAGKLETLRGLLEEIVSDGE